MSLKPKLSCFGESTILIQWPAKIDTDIRKKVLNFSFFISEKYSNAIVEVVPTYHSLAVYLKKQSNTLELLSKLTADSEMNWDSKNESSYLIEIPICYEANFGSDLRKVAEVLKISIEEIVERHTKPIYEVFFLGFLPGFPYLGGLDPKLKLARKSSPQTIIEKGSVGIGGQQTGIYPNQSPGGWHIIGRTPLDLFNPTREPPCWIQAGDYIKFHSITAIEFELIQIEQDSGTFQWRKEVLHD